VTAEGPRGERVSIFREEELFALMALANAALPASDARKITASMVQAVRDQAEALGAQIEALRVGARRMRQHLARESELLTREADALRSSLEALRRAAAVLAALLPQATAS
jgi:predicted  nucleic acid-binding Zn-ribbon protein